MSGLGGKKAKYVLSLPLEAQDPVARPPRKTGPAAQAALEDKLRRIGLDLQVGSASPWFEFFGGNRLLVGWC